MKTRTTLGTLLAAAAVAVATQVAQASTAPPPSGPTPGTYSGTSADGNTISFTVGTDASGSVAVTSVGFGVTAMCHPGSFVLNSGFGIGADAPITNNRVTVTENGLNVALNAVIAFNGSTAHGNIESVESVFQPFSGTQPTGAAFCRSVAQSFTATLQNNASVAPLRPGTALTEPSRKAR